MNTKEVRIVSESIKGEWRARERTMAKDICSNCSGLTENLRYGKANRSGDAATKKIACDLEFPRARDTPLHGEPGSQTGVDKSLTVVSVGRNGQGRACRLRMG